mmetsp:Transcript_71/g.146  ORF Transcript_71/g.146 Transcript_71/m.146 type:complete len:123 (-) Transcript_71:96-464(-)
MWICRHSGILCLQDFAGLRNVKDTPMSQSPTRKTLNWEGGLTSKDLARNISVKIAFANSTKLISNGKTRVKVKRKKNRCSAIEHHTMHCLERDAILVDRLICKEWLLEENLAVAAFWRKKTM